MEYELNNLTNEIIDEELINTIINKVTDKFKLDSSIVSIILVDNKYIHKINKEYRNVDRETDVISFAFQDNEDINECITDYGEIYISLEKAHMQALEYNHSFKREFSFLLVHGLLHLLGYDHMKKEDEEVMFNLQDEILSELNITR